MTDSQLDPEDAKLITLARASRARSGTASGAAVRDETGRTYTAADVSLPSLNLSALRLAVAMAAAGGATRLEAAAVVAEGDPAPDDIAAVTDLGPAPIHVADTDGTPRGVHTS